GVVVLVGRGPLVSRPFFFLGDVRPGGNTPAMTWVPPRPLACKVLRVAKWIEAYSMLRSWMKMSSSHCLEPNAWRNIAGGVLFRAFGCPMHEETTALQSMKFTFMLAHGNSPMTNRVTPAG